MRVRCPRPLGAPILFAGALTIVAHAGAQAPARTSARSDTVPVQRGPAPFRPGATLLVPAQQDSAPPESEPAPLLIPGRPSPGDSSVRNPAQRARDAYALGRQLELSGVPGAAIASYRNAVRFDPAIPDANFGLNLDPSHLVWLQIDYERAVYDFGERIFHAHAKDLEIRREGLYRHGTFSGGIGWQVPRIPGLGEVDWPRFVAALYAVGYDHVLSVEHEDRKFEGTQELVERGFLVARNTLRPLLV